MDENENINGKVGKIQYISFGFIMSLNFFRFSILSTIIASFPSIQYDFTLTNVQLSLISAVFYLFSFVFTYLWIYLSGKYSNRLVFLIGGAFWILPLFYFPYIQSYAVNFSCCINWDWNRIRACFIDKLSCFFKINKAICPSLFISSNSTRCRWCFRNALGDFSPKVQ